MASPLTLPLAPLAEADGYAPVARGSFSPTSCSGSPTARDVHVPLDRKDSDRNEAAQSERPARPRGQKALLVTGVLAALLAAAALAFWLLCAPAAALAPGARFLRLPGGSCAGRGLLPIRSARLCGAAAKELGLAAVHAAAVPADAAEGLPAGLVPQDCYYLTQTAPVHKETLWMNTNKPSGDAGGASGEASDRTRREPLCMNPHYAPGQAELSREESAYLGSSWGLPDISKEVVAVLPALEGNVAGLLFGTSSTTTVTTTRTTTQTRTGTSTTVTETSTSSLTTTRSSTTSTTVTGTTTMTTTYHTVPTVFCFSVVRMNSYELDNVRTMLAKGAGIFSCDDHILFSDQEAEIQAGVPVPGFADIQPAAGPSAQTTLLHEDLTTVAIAGSLEGILNTRIFMRAWVELDKDGRFRAHDWTVKVDPDAVFFPERLRTQLAAIAPASSDVSLYLVNCQISFGLFGAVEVLSRVALNAYLLGEERCKQEIDWTLMGEDLWLRKCLDLLGVQHRDDFGLLSDGYCSEQPSPCQSGKVTFHPFKTALSFLQCYTEAITPTTTSVTSTTQTMTSTTGTSTTGTSTTRTSTTRTSTATQTTTVKETTTVEETTTLRATTTVRGTTTVKETTAARAKGKPEEAAAEKTALRKQPLRVESRRLAGEAV